MDKVKFAVVGIGYIGKRYADLILNRNDSELAAIVDVDKNRIEELSKLYPTQTFLDIEQLLHSDTNYDVVCLATPNYLHCSQAKLVLKNNSHVVIEKPMGLNSSDCNEVIQLAKTQDRNIFCVMQNRYSPPSAWLKEIISNHILGKIFHVQINCFWNRDERYYAASEWKGKKALDGGTLFTQFSHFIDTLYWIFGDIENIQSRFYNNNHKQIIDFEDSGVVLFDLLKGGSGTINYSTSVWNKNLESSITIIGEKGSVKVGGQYMDKVLHCEIENYTMPDLPLTNAANDYGNYKGSAANHRYVIQNIIDVMQGKDTIKTSAEEGMKVIEMIERIYRS